MSNIWKGIHEIIYSDLLSLEFVLLFTGIFLATTVRGNRIFEMIGIVLLLVFSTVIGASINPRDRPKKQ